MSVIRLLPKKNRLYLSGFFTDHLKTNIVVEIPLEQIFSLVSDAVSKLFQHFYWCSAAVRLCQYLSLGSVVTVDSLAFFSPAVKGSRLVYFLWHFSIVTLLRVCFTFSPVGVSRRLHLPPCLTLSLFGSLLTGSAWPLGSSENSCRLVVFCHWTCHETRHLNCAVRFDFSI